VKLPDRVARRPGVHLAQSRSHNDRWEEDSNLRMVLYQHIAHRICSAAMTEVCDAAKLTKVFDDRPTWLCVLVVFSR
jgi:hypothetical protein